MPLYLYTAAVLGLGLYSLKHFFAPMPFIQQEEIGQAFWYACDGTPLLHTLFEPFKNDEFPGRFRYIEYLFEGAYWNLVKWGWLPKHLYDYSALLISFLIAGVLLCIAKQKKLKPLETLLLAALFLLSIPSYMIVNFHYRKAKFLVSLLLVLMASLQLRPQDKKNYSFPIILVSTLGFLTDPYFILLAPLMAFSLDMSRCGYKQWKNWKGLVACGWGLVAGFGLLLLLNGVVGPSINSHTQLWVSHLRIMNPAFLNLKNIPELYSIVLDSLGIFKVGPITKKIGWAIVVVLALILLKLKQNRKDYGFLLSFLLSLPIAAFLVLPDRTHVGIFASYYGHPIFLVFILGFFDLIAAVRTNFTKHSLVLFSLTLLIIIHQQNKQLVLENWQHEHVKKIPAIANLYAKDAEQIEWLRKVYKDKKLSGEIAIDFSHHQIGQFTNVYGLPVPGAEHTSLAYVLTPILFQKEIKEGRLKFFEKTAENTFHWAPLCGQSSLRF